MADDKPKVKPAVKAKVKPAPTQSKGPPMIKARAIRPVQVKEGGVAAWKEVGETFEVAEEAFSVRNMEAVHPKTQERLEKAADDKKAEVLAIRTDVRAKRLAATRLLNS